MVSLCSFFEWPVTSQVEAKKLMSHRLLIWFAILSSDTEVAVVARVAACFAGRGTLKTGNTFFSISMPMVPICRLTSWILMGDGCRCSPVQELLEFRLDCSSGLANFSDVGSDHSTPADLQSGHPISVSGENRIALLSMVEISCALKQLWALFPSWHLVIREFLLLPKTLFGPCSCSVDTTDLSTNEIEDPVSHIAGTLRLWFPFTSFMHTTESPPCVMLVDPAVIASEVPVVASSFEKTLCKSLLCCLPQLGTLQVLLLQFFDDDQVSSNWNTVWTSAHVLVVHSASLIWISCKSRLRAVHIWTDVLNPLVWQNHQHWTQKYLFLAFSGFETWSLSGLTSLHAVSSNQSLKIIKFAASSRWSCTCCSHCFFSCGKSFLVAQIRTPSDSRSGWNPSRVKTLTVFVNKFAKRTIPLELLCLTRG